ncbi:MAG: hypothetical protein IJ999_05735 [Clostridia bacterium]|nr:hypothetical protein [Clostridia bacterium]
MKDFTKTLSQVLFLLLGFILIVVVTSGFSFDTQKLTSVTFWAEIAIKEVVLLTAFNIIYDIERRNRTQNKETRFYREIGTKQLRVKKIYDNKMFDALKTAVKEENKQRIDDEATRLLHKATVRVSADDLPQGDIDLDAWLDEMQHKYKLSDKTMPKLRTQAQKIIDGKFKVNFIDADAILLDYDREYGRKRHSEMTFAVGKVKMRQAFGKAGTFVISTVAMTCINFAPFSWGNIFQALLTNTLLLLSAFLSGTGSAIKSVSMQTETLRCQNLFLSSRMGISDTFIPG